MRTITLDKPIKYFDEKITELVVTNYLDNNLALIVNDSYNETISVNINVFLDNENDFFADTNNVSQELFDNLESQGVIKRMNYVGNSGFSKFQAYRLVK